MADHVAVPGQQLYELKITASGEVRDAEGNLLNQEPVETTVVVDEAQARALGYNTEENPQ